MEFTVVWSKDARDELVEIWMASADRQGVTTATAAVDKALGTNPMQNGEQLREGLFVCAVPPLKVFYSFSELDKLVDVVGVAERIR